MLQRARFLHDIARSGRLTYHPPWFSAFRILLQELAFRVSSPQLLEIRSISKFFGPTPALRDVSVSLNAGEVLALMGHNGAGKSTLVKILAGTIRQDHGEIRIDGRLVPQGVPAAQRAGVAVIYQDLSLFPKLTVAENIAGGLSGSWSYSAGQVQRKAAAILEKLEPGSTLLQRLGWSVKDLPLAMRQRVAIARALAHDSRILILDEPTASLSMQDSDRLLESVRVLASHGVAVLFVSHRMSDVRRIAGRYLVLRDGVIALSAKADEISDSILTRAMFGQTEEPSSPATSSRKALSPHNAAPALVVSGATRRGEFQNISLSLRAGEITVLTGLTGSGRTEFAESLAGLRRLDGGVIQIFGNPLRHSGPRSAMRAGLVYVPEDRLLTGLFTGRSVAENLLGATDHLRARFGFLRKAVSNPSQWITEHNIRCQGPKALLQTLSGGNQQKVLLARWHMAKPRVLILDEPTAGVDIAAKAEIHRRLRQWADGGAALLVISSETEEALALADRILVFHAGRLVMDSPRSQISPEQLTAAMLHGEADDDAEDENASRGAQ